MKREQRIEALEYFDKHFLTIYHYHHTKKADELEYHFQSTGIIFTRAMFSYLYTGKLICRYGYKPESKSAHLFMLSTRGHERLRKLKDKHIYFNNKTK